jgi:glycosyltransferase involved in cell wall biosynthesis
MAEKISVLAPDLSGGGGTRVYLLAKVLQKLGYNVTVFGFLFGENLYPQPPTSLPVTYVSGCNYPKLLNSGFNLLKEIDGDILYAIKPRPTSFGIGLLKRLQSKKPVILDIDDWELSWFGGDDWEYKPSLKQLGRDLLKQDGALRDPQHPVYLQWSEKLIEQADAITINNKFLEYRYGGTYLPNGKDTDLFAPQKFDAQASREKYGLSDYRVLMFPGTARPHKGLEDVLMALEQLNQPDLKLVLVGGRDIGDGYVENLINQWGKWIVKLPQQPLDSMPEVVAAAHIIVVPQRETKTAIAQFPMKLTDGMAMAKPIIATRVGDIPEILADTGFLVEPQSPSQIAAMVKQILNNWDDATSMGIKARERCVNSYSLENMASVLNKVIGLVKK